jgi:hypothetical protein
MIIAQRKKFRYSSGRRHELIPWSLAEFLRSQSSSLQLTELLRAADASGKRLVIEFRDEHPVKVVTGLAAI